MATIESYVNARMYQEALAKDLAERRREQQEREEKEQEEVEELGPCRKPKSYLSSTCRASVPLARHPGDPQTEYEFPIRQAKRKGKSHAQTHDKSHQSVAAWLSDQDRGSAEKLMVPGMGRKSVYVRQPHARLPKGTWKERLIGRLSALSHALPIFSPFSTGRKTWEIFIMILVLYGAVSVPLAISYGTPTQGNIIQYLEHSIDLIFAVDICANFRTAYVDATGHLVRDTNAIAARYLKTWFAIDVFSTIPYDLLAEAVLQGGQSATQATLLKFLRTPRLLRLGRLFRMLDRVKSGNLVRVILIISSMMLISHWLACIWFMLYKFTTFADYTEWAIFLDGEIQPNQPVRAYLSAYYQSFLMMVGDSQDAYNNMERVFMIIVLIMGACFYSAMVGQMAVLVANMNMVALRHRTKQDTTLDVLRYMGLPDKQLERVQKYFTYITQYSHPASEGLSFLSDLPRSLFEELTGFLYGKHLNKVPLFAGLEPSFLNSLAARMRIVSFTPREVIFRAGDLGLEMYVIRKGCVAVIGKHQQHLGVLSEGDHFGEIAMFTMAKRTACCVALTNCDLCVLNTYDLKMVMKDFPTNSQAIQEKAEEQLRQLQLAGHAELEEDDEDGWYEEDPEEEQQKEEDSGLNQAEAEDSVNGSQPQSSTVISPTSSQHVLPSQHPARPSSKRLPRPGGKPHALQSGRSVVRRSRSLNASSVSQSQGASDAADQGQQSTLPRHRPSYNRVTSQHHVSTAQRRPSAEVRQRTVQPASAIGEAQESPRASNVGPRVSMRAAESVQSQLSDIAWLPSEVSRRCTSSMLARGSSGCISVLQDNQGADNSGRSESLMPSKSGRPPVNETRTAVGTACMHSPGVAQQRSVQRQRPRAPSQVHRRGSAEHWMQTMDTSEIRTSAELSYLQSVRSPVGMSQRMARQQHGMPDDSPLQTQPSVRTSAEWAYIHTTRGISTKKPFCSPAEGAASTRTSGYSCNRGSVQQTYNRSSNEQRVINFYNRSSVDGADPFANYNALELRNALFTHSRRNSAARTRQGSSTGVPPHEQQPVKALAAAQQQVLQLQAELAHARGEAQQGSQSRTEFFTQASSLLQLIEALGTRIAGLEAWVEDADQHLAKMETQGAKDNVLGTNLEMAGPAFHPHSMRHKSGMAPGELNGPPTLRSQVSTRRKSPMQPGGAGLHSQASLHRRPAVTPRGDTSLSGGMHQRRSTVDPSGHTLGATPLGAGPERPGSNPTPVTNCVGMSSSSEGGQSGQTTKES